MEFRQYKYIETSEARIKEYVSQEIAKVNTTVSEMDKRLTGQITEVDKRLTGEIRSFEKQAHKTKKLKHSKNRLKPYKKKWKFTDKIELRHRKNI